MNRLYHYPLSPFSRKVRLSLAEKKIEVELVEERYWEAAPEFLRRNPAGQVPILRIDGLTLCDSQAICEYLEERYPQVPLLPADAVERARVRALVQSVCSEDWAPIFAALEARVVDVRQAAGRLLSATARDR